MNGWEAHQRDTSEVAAATRTWRSLAHTAHTGHYALLAAEGDARLIDRLSSYWSGDLQVTAGSAASLRVVVRDGLAAPLAPLGYVTNRSQRKWVRDTGELLQLIFLEKRHGTHYLQWGFVCPELAEPTWGVPYREFDIGQAIVTGTPFRIRAPAKSSDFSDSELIASLGDVTARLREDVVAVAEWMRPTVSRAVLRDYLLVNRDPTDRREFLVPSKLGLKLFVAAGLAILDGDPMGCGLLADAEKELAPYTPADINGKRSAALRRLAAGLCE